MCGDFVDLGPRDGLYSKDLIERVCVWGWVVRSELGRRVWVMRGSCCLDRIDITAPLFRERCLATVVAVGGGSSGSLVGEKVDSCC